MKKERIKDFVLIVLVISSLFLTGKIWFNENLWPEGFNLFSAIESKVASWFAPQQEQQAQSALAPMHLVAYTIKDSDHASIALTDANEHFKTVESFCNLTISDAVAQPQENIAAVDEEAWKNALFNNGLFIDYGSDIPSSIFTSLLSGNEQSALGTVCTDVRYVILTAEGNVVSDISVYIKSSNGACVKITTTRPKKELTDTLALLNDYVSPTNRFSFFIGADTATGDMGEVLFHPYMLLTENETALSGIQPQNPVYKAEASIDQSKLERLLRYFNINPKTAKRYTDAEENTVFLQNQATLKISKSGLIEYTVAAGGKGLALSEQSNPSISTLSRNGTTLANDVYSIFTDTPSNLYLNTFTEQDGQYALGMDYRISGTKVVTDLENGHAVELEIKDGYVKKFTILLRKYAPSTNTYTLPSTYAAVDKMFTNISNTTPNTMIENMFIGYYDNGTDGEIKPLWFVKLEGESQRKIQE